MPRKTTPPPREADPFAKKTGARRTYYTGEFLTEAKRRIETTLQSATSIANDFGMDKSVLWRLIRSEGWIRPQGSLRLRGLSPAMRLAAAVDEMGQATPHPPSPCFGGQAPPSPCFGGQAPQPAIALATAGDTSAIHRLEAAVLKELGVVEKMRASLGHEPLRPMDAERTARTLSVLTETLSKLRRLRLAAQPQGPDTPDDILDIDEFRRDLARRIDAFVASRPNDECTDGDRAVALEPARA